jgi:PTH1 family peptidyl-tRNA hydrolase
VGARPDFLILGLGNPGRRYESTRHNFGFFVVDSLAAEARSAWRDGPGPAQWGPVSIGEAKGYVAKPMTFMNRSGLAASALLERFQGPPVDRLLVVADDMDLPLGTLRFRRDGGNGGHNGLRSLIEELGTNEFPRLRLGIGRPSSDASESVIEYVLDPFETEESARVKEVVERAAEGIRTFVRDGIDVAMNRFNAGGDRPLMHPHDGGQCDS